MFCGFAIRSREIVICYGLGGLQIPWFDRSNLFLRRISNPSGRLAVYGTPSGVWDAWRCMGRLAGCGTASGVCWTHSEGVGCLAGG